MARGKDGPGHILHRKEDVTQVDPLDMISYGIGVLLFICKLCNAHSNINQSWYMDDTGAGGMFKELQDHMQYLAVR